MIGKLQMKEHFYDRKDTTWIIEILVTFKLACDINNIDKRAAISILTHYKIEDLTNALDSRICAKVCFSSFAVSVHNDHKRPRKPSLSYPEVVDFLLKNTRPIKQLRRMTQPIFVSNKRPTSQEKIHG